MTPPSPASVGFGASTTTRCRPTPWCPRGVPMPPLCVCDPSKGRGRWLLATGGWRRWWIAPIAGWPWIRSGAAWRPWRRLPATSAVSAPNPWLSPTTSTFPPRTPTLAIGSWPRPVAACPRPAWPSVPPSRGATFLYITKPACPMAASNRSSPHRWWAWWAWSAISTWCGEWVGASRAMPSGCWAWLLRAVLMDPMTGSVWRVAATKVLSMASAPVAPPALIWSWRLGSRSCCGVPSPPIW